MARFQRLRNMANRVRGYGRTIIIKARGRRRRRSGGFLTKKRTLFGFVFLILAAVGGWFFYKKMTGDKKTAKGTEYGGKRTV